ncbi:hypothetical protein DT019_27180 [Streptomyces sp. SDr-06]|nr:hypothetical protein DT019_27180 [Streptomyces sp. SDr-06]
MGRGARHGDCARRARRDRAAAPGTGRPGPGCRAAPGERRQEQGVAAAGGGHGTAPVRTSRRHGAAAGGPRGSSPAPGRCRARCPAGRPGPELRRTRGTMPGP